MPRGVDKRRHHRFLAALEVRVVSCRGRDPSDLEVTTIDLAVGGARCASNLALDVGTRLGLAFRLVGGGLPRPVPIQADAVVLRCAERPDAPGTRRYEIAVKFERMDERERRTLQSYLNSL
ncbi:MAG: PilZ domain-containing protein [Acidobacteriota bacterium]